MKIAYFLRKYSWNETSGLYDNVARIVGPLTLLEVTARIKRISFSTLHFWNISKERGKDGVFSRVASVSAEEFTSDL